MDRVSLAAGTALSSCVGPVDSGVAIDTNTIGGHTFIVVATDADGRQLTGRKVGRRCVTATRSNRHKPKCTISRSALTRTVNGTAGANTASLGRGRLGPGSYTVTVTVLDASGHVTGRRTLRFTVAA